MEYPINPLLELIPKSPQLGPIILPDPMGQIWALEKKKIEEGQ